MNQCETNYETHKAAERAQRCGKSRDNGGVSRFNSVLDKILHESEKVREEIAAQERSELRGRALGKFYGDGL